MRKECIAALLTLIIMGSFFNSYSADSNTLDKKPVKVYLNHNKFFNQTDIPTWVIGDTWTYESSVFFDGENGSFDGCIEDMAQTVVGVVNLTQNKTIPFFVVNLTGNISGELTYEGINGDLEGIIQGELVVRLSDLAIMRAEIISSGTIMIYILPVNYGLNCTLLFQPSLENYDFPLKQEETWEVFSQVTSEGEFYIGDLINESLSFESLMSGFMEFISIQNVSVPAGTFESCQLNSLENGSFNYWYSPLVKNAIKSVLNMSNDNSTANIEMNLTSYSLTNQQINITQNLMLPSVYANEYVNISGRVSDTVTGGAIPNASVLLRLPCENQVWDTTTNNLGYYHVLVTAPIINDDTPSNSDFGSDGIIAWTAGNYGDGYRIATLTVEGINYTFFLMEGWNLISITTKNTWSAETLGQNITHSTVIIRFNASTQTFITHVVGTPHDDFPIEEGIGYFVYANNTSNFTTRGVPLSTVLVYLQPPWNLIGWFKQRTTTAESLGQNISNTTVIVKFNASTQTFITHVVGTPHDNFIVKPGMGLFVYTINETWWSGDG